jgi:hypothetical protein
VVKLIQNITSPNNGERQKNNNDNITKYLEFNKDNLLKLAEKHYENLVEALTNNVIVTAVTSSNHASSLPPSSSTFNAAPYKQSDTYRIEEQEIYDNSKDNIAD